MFFAWDPNISYSVNLISMLARQKPELPIESLEDLSKQNDIRLVFEAETFWETIFKSSRDDIMQKAHESSKTVASEFDAVLDMVRKSSGGIDGLFRVLM